MPWKKKIAWISIFSIIYLTFLFEHTYKIIIIHLLNKQGYANFLFFTSKVPEGRNIQNTSFFIVESTVLLKASAANQTLWDN